jgi:hypothetical protein
VTTSVVADFPPNDGREWDCQCARCGSSCVPVDCTECAGDGVTHHDCGEDCCNCRNPEDNVRCEVCRGRGGWHECASGADYCEANPRNRADARRGQIEWFTRETR